MQGGIHLFVGLLLCVCFPKRHAQLRFSVVLGSILPDIDLFVCIGVCAFAWIFLDEKSAEEAHSLLHRTMTHSLAFVCAISGGLLMLSVLNVHSLRKIHFLGKPLNLNAVGLGLTLGILSHLLLDLIYMDGVGVFWPVDRTMYFIPLIMSHYRELSLLTNKIIFATDFLTEVVLFYVPLILYIEGQSSQKVKPADDIWGIAVLDLYKTLSLFIAFTVAVLFVIDAFVNLELNLFLGILYIPGTLFECLRQIAPWYFRHTLVALPDLLHFVCLKKKNS